MNFDLNEIGEQSEIYKADQFQFSQKSKTSQNLGDNSGVLDSVYEEIESLREKLKLAHKQLLFFEAENNRVLQEKNKLFFENKNLIEKNTLFLERSQDYEKQNTLLGKINLQNTEKISNFISLINSQKVELSRMSKFYLKIKNVIRPYITQLKTKNADLESLLARITERAEQSELNFTQTLAKIDQLKIDFENSKRSYQIEKSELIKSYEEQLNDLAKDAVTSQQFVEDSRLENSRLKKSLELKHFVDNELIKFKRDSLALLGKNEILEQNLSKLLTENAHLNNEVSTSRQMQTQLQTQIEQKDYVLENFRKNIVACHDEIEKQNMRLSMFEKLNTKLSLLDNHLSIASERVL